MNRFFTNIATAALAGVNSSRECLPWIKCKAVFAMWIQKPAAAKCSLVLSLCLCASVVFLSGCRTDDFTFHDSAGAKHQEFTGYVESAYFAVRSKGQPTFLTVQERGVHAASTPSDQSALKRSEDRAPGEELTVVIWGVDRARFPEAPEKHYLHKTIRVRGKLGSYRGKPQMQATTPKQIKEKSK